MPMRRKVALVLMVTTAAALLIASSGQLIERLIKSRERMIEELSAEAQTLAMRSSTALEANDKTAAAKILAALQSDADLACAAIYTADGEVFADQVGSVDRSMRPPRRPELAGHYFEQNHLMVFRHIRAPNHAKLGTVMVCSSLKRLQWETFQQALTAVVLAIVGALLALLLTTRLRRLISEPFLKLTGVANAVIQKKDFSVRATKTSEDEAGQLIDAFNEMLVQIQNRDAALHTVNDELEKRVQERTQLMQRELVERLKTEEHLWESQRTLSTLMSNLPGAAYRCGNNGDRTMEFISEGSHDLTGYRPADLIRNATISYARLIHPEDQGMVWNEIQKGVMAKQPFKLTYRILTATKQEKWVWEQGMGVFDGDGTLQALEGFITDITERKRAEEERNRVEEQLRQVQKMEAVGRLAGGVAHDFNNILTVITGYCDVTLRRTDTSDPLYKNVEEIGRAASRASSLTRQLLAFSRKQVLQPKVLELNGVVTGMEKMLRRLIGADVELRTSLQHKLGLVKADPGQIEQVIMNLVVNARDAMPHGGAITIETGNVTLDKAETVGKRDAEPGNYVLIAVSDTGVGMSEAIRAHLFEPFFTTKGPGKGTGLGLATSYGIVRQSGGHISVQSEPDHGSMFKIYLPRVEEALVIEPAEPKDSALPAGKEVLLMVEDEVAVRELSALILRECGYTVIEASNGQEGLHAAEAQNGDRINLVISDIIMPQMGGQEMVDRLRKQRPELKVLFTSGYTADALIGHNALEHNMAFLEKPYSPKQLAEKVRQMLDETEAVAV